MFLLNILLSLSLSIPAFADSALNFDCATGLKKLNQVALQADSAPDSFKSVLNEILNRPEIPTNIREKILREASFLKIEESDVPVEKIKLKTSFFSPFKSKKIRGAILTWPSKEQLQSSNPEILSIRMADIIGQLLFEPARIFNVYRFTPRAFIRENVEALTYKLYTEYYLLSSQARDQLGKGSAISRIAKLVLRTILPIPFSEVKHIKLDKKITRLFDEGGPQRVYRYLLKFYGAPLAIQYWSRHLSTAFQVLFLTFSLYMAPTAYGTYQLMKQESSVSINNDDRVLAESILKNFKKPDIELLQQIKDLANDKSEDATLKQFLKSYESEERENAK